MFWLSFYRWPFAKIVGRFIICINERGCKKKPEECRTHCKIVTPCIFHREIDVQIFCFGEARKKNMKEKLITYWSSDADDSAIKLVSQEFRGNSQFFIESCRKQKRIKFACITNILHKFQCLMH